MKADIVALQKQLQGHPGGSSLAAPVAVRSPSPKRVAVRAPVADHDDTEAEDEPAAEDPEKEKNGPITLSLIC